MLAGVARLLNRALRRDAAAPRHGARTRTITLLVAADPDAALMASAQALKRLGARIIRYDGDAGALEARRGSGADAALLSVRAAGEREGATRLHVESLDRRARELLREFRRELSGKRTRR